jgi:hypothetical protein
VNSLEIIVRVTSKSKALKPHNKELTHLIQKGEKNDAKKSKINIKEQK